MSALPSASALPACVFYHLLYPVTNHCIHHHMEYGGGQRVPLCHPPKTHKLLPVVASRSCNHPQPISVRTEDAARSRSHAASLQDFQAYVPVQVIIRLVRVQKYHIQDLLPHGRYLMKQFGLKSGNTCAKTCLEFMEEVVVGNGGCEPSI